MAKWRLVIPSNRNGQIGDVPIEVLREVLASGYYCEAFDVETGDVVPIRPDYDGPTLSLGNVVDARGRRVRAVVIPGRPVVRLPDDVGDSESG